MKVQTVDMELMLHGGKDSQQKFAQDLGRAFRDIGFAAISGHGFNAFDRGIIHQAVKTYFAKSTEEKMQHLVPGGHGQRGYTAFGVEHAKGDPSPDQKEFFQWGPMDSEARGLKPNVAIDPATDEAVAMTFHKLERLGNILMEAIAMDLELPRDYFAKYLAHGESILRAIHYPTQPEAPKDGIRAGAHEDINLITLLMGASAAGLELLDANGAWHSIHVEDDTILINVGDMLQRFTNGELVATKHRVVNPSEEAKLTPRFSIPFFLHPTGDMPLNALPKFISEDRPKRFKDMTAGEYLRERLEEIGLM